MPPGVIIPELAYHDVREAAAWLCETFGFVERLRIGDHRAQLSFGGESIVVTRLGGDAEAIPAGSPTHSIMVCVDDLESHYQRARQCGARIVSPPADYPFGEKQYTADDIGGHRWTFSQSIADVDPRSWGGTLPDRA
jgi:uncharacterized glyoxalase superfamily protein PhnB